MTDVAQITFASYEPESIRARWGTIAVLSTADEKLDNMAGKVNQLSRRALDRAVHAPTFADLSDGDVMELGWPAGLSASKVLLAKCHRRGISRKTGANIAKHATPGEQVLILARDSQTATELAYGFALRAYGFDKHKTADAKKVPGPVLVMTEDPEAAEFAFQDRRAAAEGVRLCRDLTNEPANVLTTVTFGQHIEFLRNHGVIVEILEEPQLEELGMRTLLAVGQGSRSPSKVAVMMWNGGGDAAPLAICGKGVVFDTGGISIKPAGGMEDMTMDMGGAAVVTGVMHTIARRNAKANVVGIVGLVENMPDGNAQRPGDVVRTMKGDTVEVINTDAEGRLVLADVLWYAQQRFEPEGIIDLATLTGAIIVGLGHVNAGMFANDEQFANKFQRAAKAEDEGLWRMPLDPAYDKLLKSRVADIANVGGRAAGAVTAAVNGAPLETSLLGMSYLS
ncbi:MAG: leucyl aminopeptidase, partial [Pseudomonadota bacterium]